jgi:FAD-dependent urate hydroxylase
VFDSLPELNSAITDHLQDWRFYSVQSWVKPRKTAEEVPIHDVLIVGAGQSGLALAYSLKLRGIRRLIVLDAQRSDRPGPWSSFARMRSLRSPKAVPGPECFNPMLTFKAWYCAKYSRAEYEQFRTIPVTAWCDYLAWYRAVLGIDTLSETNVTGIEWDADERCLRVTADSCGVSSTFFARKVCLATGMDSAGRWAPPDSLVASLPREAYFGAWESIPAGELSGRDVAVVGAGASGFDNASFAVEAQCKSVTIFARRPFPSRDIYLDLWRGRDDAQTCPEDGDTTPADLLDAVVAHHGSIQEEARIRLLRALFRNGRTPSTTKYLSELSHLAAISVLEDHPVEKMSYCDKEGRIRINARGREFYFDRVIFATGVQAGLQHRPELAAFCDEIMTWEDHGNAGEALLYGLGRYPKLSTNYQLQSVNKDDSELQHIYCLADPLHVTVGLQSTPYVVAKVAYHIGVSLYQEQLDEIVAFINGNDCEGLSGPEPVAPAFYRSIQ